MRKYSIYIAVLLIVAIFYFRDKIENIGRGLSFGKLTVRKTVSGITCSDILNMNIPKENLEPWKMAGISAREYFDIMTDCDINTGPFDDFKISEIYARLSDEVALKVLYFMSLPNNDPDKKTLDSGFFPGKSEALNPAYVIEAIRQLWQEGETGSVKGRVFEKIALNQYGIHFNYNSLLINQR